MEKMLMILLHNKKITLNKTDGQALKQLGCFQTGPLVQFFDQKMIPQGWPSKLFSMWRAKKLCSFFTERKKKIRMKRNETSLTHKNKNYLFESEKKIWTKEKTKQKNPSQFRERLLLLFHIQVPKCKHSFSKSKVEIVTKIGIFCVKMCENSIFTL